jgi:hypothetical protein
MANKTYQKYVIVSFPRPDTINRGWRASVTIFVAESRTLRIP